MRSMRIPSLEINYLLGVSVISDVSGFLTGFVDLNSDRFVSVSYCFDCRVVDTCVSDLRKVNLGDEGRE